MPKVFISHASEDHEFVHELATKLMSKGVVTWVDDWEIRAGDSLVDKIYNEGLKNADAVIVVLSQHSVAKPWVRDEMNTSTVMRITKQSRLIPIVLDGCEVPTALLQLKWVKVVDRQAFQTEFEDILSGILGVSVKPQLGALPKYAILEPIPISGLMELDAIILEAMCEALLADKAALSLGFGGGLVRELAQILETSEAEVMDSVEVLERHGYLTTVRVIGGISQIAVRDAAFQDYCREHRPGYAELERLIAARLVNGQAETSDALRDLGQPFLVIRSVLKGFEGRGLVQLMEYSYGRVVVARVSAELRRALRG